MIREAIPVLNPIKGIDIEDKNLKIVYLKSGKYLIDGEVITVELYSEAKVQVKDASDIRKITENEYIKEYVCGEENLSVKQYNEQIEQLLSKRKYNGYDDEWKSLEDEFAYKKFIRTWTPIYNIRQEISEPLLVQFKKTKYDTGCQYIHNAFLNGDDKDFTLFTYEQGQVWLGITRECFEELGMKYKENVNYFATNNKKIWSNSSHSCIRYVTGFGGYVFNDNWKNPRVIKGTLEDVRKRYEDDRNTIRKIIIDKYNNHFGCINVGKFDFDRLRIIISNAQENLFDIDPKQKSYQAWQRTKDKLKEAQDMINVAYEVSMLPYIMRFNHYEEFPYRGTYINMAAWCNQPNAFKKKSYREFVEYQQFKHQKECSETKYLKQIERDIPELA